jgi:MFS family permease
VAGSLRRLGARVLVDGTPLRESRDFRLLYLGQLVSATGSQSLAVGLLGLAQLVPLVLGSLVGGALADAHDRRRLLLLAQVLLGVTSLALAVNALSPSPRVGLIYVLTGLQAGFTGLDLPTRTAALPTLVRREILASALALNQLLWQACQVVGPAVAGVLIARVSVTATYAADAATFVVGAAFVLAVRPLLPEGGGTRASGSSILEGLRYLRGKRALQGTFVVDINAMVFGMPRAVFPEIGLVTFGSAEVAGLLYSAPAAGALIGAATSGWLQRIERQGRAIVISVMVWGASIALFGLTSWLPAALFLLAVAGAADLVSAVFRNAVLQMTVPDRRRGRLSALFRSGVAGGPRLGDLEAGAAAALVGPQVSVVTGGVACIAGALVVARMMPELAHWNRRQHGGIDDVEEEPVPAD